MKRRLTLLLLLLLLLTLWWLGPDEAELLQWAKAHLAEFRAQYAAYPVGFACMFFLLYAFLTAFIPVGIPLMLLAGAIFPFWLGTFLVCTAYSTGSLLNFLFARHFMGQIDHARLAPVRAAIAEDGWFALFVLRLIPVLPAQGVTFAMGTMPIGLWPFFTATWAGDLPLSAFLIYMGQRLAEVEDTGELLSPDLLFAMTAMALLLWAGRRYLIRRRVLAVAAEEGPPAP